MWTSCRCRTAPPGVSAPTPSQATRLTGSWIICRNLTRPCRASQRAVDAAEWHALRCPPMSHGWYCFFGRLPSDPPRNPRHAHTQDKRRMNGIYRPRHAAEVRSPSHRSLSPTGKAHGKESVTLLAWQPGRVFSRQAPQCAIRRRDVAAPMQALDLLENPLEV